MSPSKTPGLLILGGTHEALAFARFFHNHGIRVIYSISGLVRQPVLPCTVISGGFSHRGGLSQVLLNEPISAVLDATHPFATTISQRAIQATKQHQIPYWRWQRPPWRPTRQDQWQTFGQWSALAQAVRPYSRILLTVGRLSRWQWQTLAPQRKQHLYLRTATANVMPYPMQTYGIQQIGSLSIDQEIALLSKHRIEVLVTKNSGGDPTYAKIEAARRANIPVLLLNRPFQPTSCIQFSRLESCHQHILDYFAHAL